MLREIIERRNRRSLIAHVAQKWWLRPDLNRVPIIMRIAGYLIWFINQLLIGVIVAEIAQLGITRHSFTFTIFDNKG